MKGIPYLFMAFATFALGAILEVVVRHAGVDAALGDTRAQDIAAALVLPLTGFFLACAAAPWWQQAVRWWNTTQSSEPATGPYGWDQAEWTPEVRKALADAERRVHRP